MSSQVDPDTAEVSSIRTARVVKIKLLRKELRPPTMEPLNCCCSSCSSSLDVLSSRIALLEGSLQSARDTNQQMEHRERALDLSWRNSVAETNKISSSVIEGYDVLVSLLESELGLLLANCSAHLDGINSNNNSSSSSSHLLLAAAENKRTASTAAAEFLKETLVTPDSAETRVRSRIVTLRNRLLQQLLQQPLEPSPPPSPEPLPPTLALQKKTDLETLVLVEELCVLRHERNVLKDRLNSLVIN